MVEDQEKALKFYTEKLGFILFFACGEDLSLEPTTDPLPEQISSGEEPLCAVGAIADG
jgi:catechol 2,3-dioxygenase-like lactoylglutathione lyase family enzyme